MDTTTKWDTLSDAERVSLEKIPFESNCVSCDIYIATEADFAKHFILRPPFRNLGNCPLTLLKNID